GLAAIRHRAVADRAGVPLSATTYYFASIDDLIASVVEQSAMYEHERMQELVDRITLRGRAAEATADLLVDLFVTPGGTVDREELIARYERITGSARVASLRELHRSLAVPYSNMLAEVLRKPKRETRMSGMMNLSSLINGTIMTSLLDESLDLRKTTRAALVPVIDVFAPPLGAATAGR